MKSGFASLKDVTCKDLRIHAITKIKSIDKLNFTFLELSELDENVMNQIFEINSNLVKRISITSFRVEKLELKFENFPNIQSIYFPSYRVSITSLSSNIFNKLKYIKEIHMKESNLYILEENSLLLSSNEYVKLYFNNNTITIDQF